MYVKKETKDYIWIIPLVAGVLAIIAIFTPTAHFGSGGVTWDWLMWDLTTMRVIGYEPISVFMYELDFIIPSIITTSAILLSAVNLFILSNTTRKRNLNTKDFILMSIISAVLSISIMIYYSIAMGTAFYDGVIIEGITFPAGFHFWVEFRPSFGIFLPFISAILSFVGVGLFRYYSNRKDDIIPPRMVTVRESVPDKTVTVKNYVPVSKPMGARNFCPECGYKLLKANTNFCTNCGFKF